MKSFGSYVFIGLQLMQVSSAAEPKCANAYVECATKAMASHPAAKLSYWQEALRKPLTERIAIAPPELLDYIRLDTIKNGLPNRPRISDINAAFLNDARSAVMAMPELVRKLISPTLAGIYFVEDIGGTGYTDEIRDANGRAVAGFIVLDPLVLIQRKANDWITWRENTPFKTSKIAKLIAKIEDPANDTVQNAIQFIALHEMGHVFSIGRKIHPSWNSQPKEVNVSEYSFLRSSWTRSVAGRFEPRIGSEFSQRKDVVYYFGAKLTGDQMRDTYSNLAKTDFPTLYSSTNPSDDFAESFATYVHTIMLGKPFQVTITVEGAQPYRYVGCWAEVRCAKKRKLLESYLVQ